ncbi:hypothetical protein QJS66_15210 [Kocuria rhizophila]|nr:hypothetical protein QJS66_15210 [Kocuria rhizophila]
MVIALRQRWRVVLAGVAVTAAVVAGVLVGGHREDRGLRAEPGLPWNAARSHVLHTVAWVRCWHPGLPGSRTTP